MINRIALISDLHLNHWLSYYRQSLAPEYSSVQSLFQLVIDKCVEMAPDLIVVAGDFGDGIDPSKIQINTNHIPWVFVKGNHDFYDKEWTGETISFENEDIIGATLWTNFRYLPYSECERIFRRINDYYYIRGVDVGLVKNTFGKTWRELMKADKEIVVTHFPPFIGSVAEKFYGDPINPYFVNDMEEQYLSEPRNTKLWMVGHVHHRHTYKVGSTMVACNPLGYPRENFGSIKDYQPMEISRKMGGWYVTA